MLTLQDNSRICSFAGTSDCGYFLLLQECSRISGLDYALNANFHSFAEHPQMSAIKSRGLNPPYFPLTILGTLVNTSGGKDHG